MTASPRASQFQEMVNRCAFHMQINQSPPHPTSFTGSYTPGPCGPSFNHPKERRQTPGAAPLKLFKLASACLACSPQLPIRSHRHRNTGSCSHVCFPATNRVDAAQVSSWPRDRTHVLCLLYWQADTLPLSAPWEDPNNLCVLLQIFLKVKFLIWTEFTQEALFQL